MAQVCGNCSTAFPDNARFCPSCGAAAAIPQDTGAGGFASQQPPAFPSAGPTPPEREPLAPPPQAAPPLPPPPVYSQPPAGDPGQWPPPGPYAPAARNSPLPPPLDEIWTRAGSMEFGIMAGLGVLALVFSLVGLIMTLVTDPNSESQLRGDIWQQVAIALAIGAAAWSVAARAGLREGYVFPGDADRFTLYGLAGIAAVFAVIGFIQTVGYSAEGDFGDEGFTAAEEHSWLAFALAWAFVAFAWAALTRQLEAELARKVAIGLTAAGGITCLAALIIGSRGSGIDAYDNWAQATGWFGAGLVFMTLAAGALFGRRE